MSAPGRPSTCPTSTPSSALPRRSFSSAGSSWAERWDASMARAAIGPHHAFAMRASIRSAARRRSALRRGRQSSVASPPPAAKVAPAVEAPIRFPVEGPGGFRATLRFTAFRNIWFAQLAAQLADKFLLFSLIILAYNISGGSTPVAVTLLAYTVPAVLFAPPAGVIADRVNRKTIMVWSNLGRGAAIALIPLCALVPGLRTDFTHLLLITLIFSSVGQLFSPAEAAVIPTILPRSALITANSMSLLTMVLTLVVGGALAPILSRIDLYAPYWCAVALLAVAGALIFASEIPKLERHTESPVEESRSRFRL